MSAESFHHRVMASAHSVVSAKMRIEYHLGVKVSQREPNPDGRVPLDWFSPIRKPDLKFLMPDILPPE